MNANSWKKLEWGAEDMVNQDLAGLHAISEARMGVYIPEVHLWLSVLIDAARHKDMEFIEEHAEKICQWAQLNYNQVINAFKIAWEN